MTYYKVLVNGRSCFGGRMDWALPAPRPDGTWEPGAWMEVAGPIELCYRGLHLTRDPYGQWPSWGMAVYEAEPGPILDRRRDKVVTDRARLLRPVPHPVWWGEAVRFVEEELPTTRWFRPDGEPDPAWHVFTAPSWREAADACIAAIEAAGEDPFVEPGLGEASEAAVAAADAAGREIPRRIASGIAIERAERDAKRAAWAVRGPDGDAPSEAAQDAADFVHAFVIVRGICADLDIAPEHRALFESRWEVYRKGYMPLGWLEGRRCVYVKTPRRRRRKDG
jgi:hypothetical protein